MRYCEMGWPIIDGDIVPLTGWLLKEDRAKDW